jgi:hypothetical protein
LAFHKTDLRETTFLKGEKVNEKNENGKEKNTEKEDAQRSYDGYALAWCRAVNCCSTACKWQSNREGQQQRRDGPAQ